MTPLKSFTLLLTAAVFMIATAVASEQNTTLKEMGQKLKIDEKQISVSGISSGGFMAHQFHVAHSANLMGAGIIAGGLYYCAKGYIFTALGECTTIGEEPIFGWEPVPYSGPCPAPLNQQARCKDKAKSMAEESFKYTMNLDKNKIDNPKNIIGDRVILILGKSDRLVPEGVMDATDMYYKMIYKNYEQAPPKDTLLTYLKTLPAEHSVPTDNFIGLKVGLQVGKCQAFGSPYLNVCTKEDCASSCCPESVKTACDDPTDSANPACTQCDLQCSTQCVASIDAAGQILKHIYGDSAQPWIPRSDIKVKDWGQSGPPPTVGQNCKKDNETDTRCQWLRERIFSFSQESKLPDHFPTFLADKGFIFVPKQCVDGHTECKLHIAFHGCQQGYGFKEKDTVSPLYSNEWTNFVENAGFNEWADANNIVVLYPQALTSYNLLVLANPMGCWDFWGYSGKNSNYHTKEGRQISAVWQMVEALVPSLKQ